MIRTSLDTLVEVRPQRLSGIPLGGSPPTVQARRSLPALVLTLSLGAACTGPRFESSEDSGISEEPTSEQPSPVQDAASEPGDATSGSSTVPLDANSASAPETDDSLTMSSDDELSETQDSGEPSDTSESTSDTETATSDLTDPSAIGNDAGPDAAPNDAGPSSTTDTDPSATEPLTLIDGGSDGSRLDASADELDASSTLPGWSDADASQCDAGCDAAVDAAPDAAPDATVDAGPPIDPSDECPDHPEQTLRGSCGCGFEPHEDCAVLEEGLAHRYRFDGEGDIAFDSVGDADAEIIGADLEGTGTLDLMGSGAYVALPAHVPMESETGGVTFEAWLTWYGGADWQRIFDFGNLEGDDQEPETYVYLSPRGGQESGRQAFLFAYSVDGSGATQHLHGPDALPTDTVSHVAVVIHTVAGRVALYHNGTRLGATDFTPSLDEILDESNNLGRSLFDSDPALNASLHEFRIYNRSLNEEQIGRSYELGADTFYSQPKQ